MIYSHPNRLLVDHLNGVKKRMLQMFEDMSLDCKKAFGISNKAFESLIVSIAISHDIGKATKLFQKKLENPNIRVSHSPVSALYSFLAAKKALRGQVPRSEEKILSFFAFSVVRRHHGFLVRPIDEVSNMQWSEEKLIKESGYIDKDFAKWFKKETGVAISREASAQVIEELKNIDEELEKALDKRNDFSFYFLQNLLYSLLVDADRIDAATYGKHNVDRIKIKDNSFEKYVKSTFKHPKTFMEKIRTNSHKKVLTNLLLSPNRYLYTLTLPTGGGKTLTSLSAALKLRKMVEKKQGRSPRIIYALPFTSLIDQNASVISTALEKSFGRVTSDLFLVQHHLAPTQYVTKENESLSLDISSLLISSWNAEIVATTFVSLFEGIVSNDRSNVRKLHNVIGSIIILDEVQNIPHEYWKLVRSLFEFMAKKMNTYFILATATQPKILENVVELSQKPLKWFLPLKRVKMTSNIEKINDYDELFRNVKNDLMKGKKVLVIFNTISTAQTFFKMFSGMNLKKYFLSSGIIPFQREKIIKKVKEGADLLVSTQVVEAGMEFDFNVVYRDIAPMDSIIQSGGRCNRHYKEKGGTIHVFSLKNENGNLYSKYVYDSVLIDISYEILKNTKFVDEKDFIPKLVEPYFGEMSKRMTNATSDAYINAMKYLLYSSYPQGDTSISRFSIINSKLFRIPIYIQYNEEAKELWNKFEDYQDLPAKEWYEKAKTLFKKMGKYMVTVNATEDFLKNAPPLFSPAYGKAFYLVESENIGMFYDEETGFHIEENGGMIM